MEEFEKNSTITKGLRQKYAPDGSDLRYAQSKMLDLLCFLDKICSQHNLTYWLDSGTLLGAARHGGFIPWDDDTDVCMPAEDARKLKELMADKVFDGHIVLQHRDTDCNYLNSDWMTLRDTKIEYVQDSLEHNRLRYRGLQVDIFIVDKGLSPISKFLIKAYQAITVYLPMRRNNPLAFMRPLVNLNHAVIDRCLVPLGRLLSGPKEIYNYGLGNPFVIHHEKKTIFPLKKINFEGIPFNCPNDIDTYLTNLYGEWRRIPDESKIMTHNVKFNILD